MKKPRHQALRMRPFAEDFSKDKKVADDHADQDRIMHNKLNTLTYNLMVLDLFLRHHYEAHYREKVTNLKLDRSYNF